jgi:AcrR family transcriptional regulator
VETVQEVSDPRIVRSRQAVVKAAVELIAESGLERTTIEAIAARSGAAKTTIYRHWPDKSAVLRDAIRAVIPSATAPDSGRLRNDLATFARDVAVILNTAPTSGIIPGLIDSAEREQEPAELLAQFAKERRHPVLRAVTRAVERGEAGPGNDADLIASLLLGPLFYRRLVSREPVTDSFVERVTGAVLDALEPPIPHTGGDWG